MNQVNPVLIGYLESIALLHFHSVACICVFQYSFLLQPYFHRFKQCVDRWIFLGQITKNVVRVEDSIKLSIHLSYSTKKSFEMRKKVLFADSQLKILNKWKQWVSIFLETLILAVFKRPPFRLIWDYKDLQYRTKPSWSNLKLTVYYLAYQNTIEKDFCLEKLYFVFNLIIGLVNNSNDFFLLVFHCCIQKRWKFKTHNLFITFNGYFSI